MNDIIRMAREAGAWSQQFKNRDVEYVMSAESLERFAALVAAHALVEPCCQQFDKCQKVCMPRAAAAEREACAQVAEDMLRFYTQAVTGVPQAIRARGQA
jgi:hypothetical protein